MVAQSNHYHLWPMVYTAIVLLGMAGYVLYRNQKAVGRFMQYQVRIRDVLIGAGIVVFAYSVHILFAFLVDSAPFVPQARYDVVINSFSRIDRIQNLVDHYLTCDGMARVVVVWGQGDNETPEDYLNADTRSDPRVMIFHPENPKSLNSRFGPNLPLLSEAVVTVDDDIIPPCSSLLRMYQVWEQFPDRLNGPFARAHSAWNEVGCFESGGKVTDLESAGITADAARNGSGIRTEIEQSADYDPNQGCHYHYSYPWVDGTYSIVLTKFSMQSAGYLDLFFDHPSANCWLDFVDRHRNCEDIAMALMVGSITNKAPVYNHASPAYDLGWSGISGDSGHMNVRDYCLDYFVSQCFSNRMHLPQSQVVLDFV
eukprot:Clim_evm6s37 gene=Clim_evmTU6s37